MLGFIQMRHVVLVYRSIVIRVGYELDYRFEVDSERNLDQLGDSTLFVIAEIGCIFNLEGILVNHSDGPRLTPIDLCHTFNIIEANKISCVEIMRSLFMQRHDSGVRFTDVIDDEWVRLFSVLVDDLKPLTEIHKNEGVEPYYPAVDESDGFLLRSADEVNL